MELDWLETFLAVVDRGGFTAAAIQVHRSQSRVSAHIAALEREIGVQLIERGRRPAVVTEAGRVFAVHAREILAGVRTARSAVAAMRALSDQHIVVQTTSWLGATLFPQVLADVLGTFPDARVTVVERGRGSSDGDGADVAVLAVNPADREPEPQARRQILWWEPLRVVVPDAHRLARSGEPVPLGRLADHRLVLCTASSRALDANPAGPGAPGADRGRLTVDAPQTVAAMVRSGLGVGVVNAGAVGLLNHSGLAVLEFESIDGTPDPGFEVAVDWFDVLLASPVGQALHEGVLAASMPSGALRRPR
ncbi:LysR family transcriptional regulator [Nakamurella sp.]|uniref:LysR family transcriptional regulator n=1 Tax=Nakamurella sp. TaxID=1869182 RepID=UPI0037832C5D